MDRLLVYEKGFLEFSGTWDELIGETCIASSSSTIQALQASVQESKETGHKATLKDEGKLGNDSNLSMTNEDGKVNNHTKSIHQAEEREHGLSSVRTWITWFYFAGGWTFTVLQITFMAIDRISYVGTEWWLAIWTDASDGRTVYALQQFELPSQEEDSMLYVHVYMLLVFFSLCFCIMRSQWVVMGGLRSSKLMFQNMLNRVVYTPMHYFDTTPMGRVLNRFTYDVETLDITLAQAMSVTLIAFSWFFAGISVMVIIFPYILLILIPVIFSYFLLQLFYRKSSVDLQRLDAVTRSPIQALIAEGLDGALTIRAFGQESNFINKFFSKLDENDRAMLNFLVAHRWLGIALELLGSFIALVATMSIVCYNDVLNIQPGLAAVLIIWSSNFTITLGFMIDNINESEAAITAVERVSGMATLPQEFESKKNVHLGTNWPQNGTLEFKDVCMRYRPGLPLALNRLSFRLNSRRRCGVVGRTGAGKSSITVALFRLVNIEEGEILLDGVNLAHIALDDVRGRRNGMAIIPQDPVLFAGTLRSCLDPSGSAGDEVLLDALISVKLLNTLQLSSVQSSQGSNNATEVKTPLSDKSSILDMTVKDGGSNFSAGERQLICLARALISKPRLLVLDEATASIDGETDIFIQRMLRTRFQESTLLTVAHRLNTIMDYDDVLVMDKGEAAEFGPPHELLQRKDSIFSELVDATGAESAASLRQMAFESATQNVNN